MVFNTPHQKKSALVTLIVMSFVLFLLFFCGLRYMDPPEEYGVAINFGTSDFGSGPPVLNKTVKSDLEQNSTSPVEEKVVEETNIANEEILSQNTDQAPVIKSSKPLEKAIVNKAVDQKKVESVKKPDPTPTPNKETQNALNNLFGKKSDGETSKSEGDDAKQGVKGNIDGDAEANKYYGNTGLGGDGNYLLKGRKILTKPIKKPNCNEDGIVVVKIEVDNMGKVIKAVPGVKGTTNHNPCLLEPAKKAALLTKWNPDGNAPIKQIGYIRYKFMLSQ